MWFIYESPDLTITIDTGQVSTTINVCIKLQTLNTQFYNYQIFVSYNFFKQIINFALFKRELKSSSYSIENFWGNGGQVIGPSKYISLCSGSQLSYDPIYNRCVMYLKFNVHRVNEKKHTIKNRSWKGFYVSNYRPKEVATIVNENH